MSHAGNLPGSYGDKRPVETILVQYNDDPLVENHVMAILREMNLLIETAVYNKASSALQIEVSYYSDSRTDILAARLTHMEGVSVIILKKGPFTPAPNY
ncbi:MAG TPA: hypothetical protein VFC34_08260 [Puia sp.]|nr:hypothetical protein [Puia sp.]